MIRNAVGSLLALLGAAAAVWSPFRSWYDGRLGRDFRIGQLFDSQGVTGDGASLMNGLFLPMLVAAVVTLLGLLLRSRLLVLLAGVLALGFTVLWMVRQGQAEGSLTAGGGGLDIGAGLGLAAGALLLLAALVMSGRRARSARHRRTDGAEDEPNGPYGTEPGPGPYTGPDDTVVQPFPERPERPERGAQPEPGARPPGEPPGQSPGSPGHDHRDAA
ncbi:hypothetical protein GCM10009801_03480 [Streptomyces albiaxialis]|uniref:Integral membrane protein n=1 Tax=Streptomyces albiaxialis TaxID=329523 RepID=A0ABN2VFR3_9ACTN